VFDKIKSAKPEKVYFMLDNGEPCFYTYRAFPHKKEGKDVFSEKQLNAIAREKFNIERFEQEQPSKKGMWELVEEDGQDRAWKLKFYPYRDTELEDKYNSSKGLNQILELIGPNP
jgi:hypothetical protein